MRNEKERDGEMPAIADNESFCPSHFLPFSENLMQARHLLASASNGTRLIMGHSALSTVKTKHLF